MGGHILYIVCDGGNNYLKLNAPASLAKARGNRGVRKLDLEFPRARDASCMCDFNAVEVPPRVPHQANENPDFHLLGGGAMVGPPLS